MKTRFYRLTGLNAESLPNADWHKALSKITTGCALEVIMPTDIPGAPEHRLIIDEPVANVAELRQAILRKIPEARSVLEDRTLGFSVNGQPLLVGEKSTPVGEDDQIVLVPVMAGG